jgi:hypothetical protein
MSQEIKHRCEDCPMRKRAELKPNSLFAKIWRWHTTWCPEWRAFRSATRNTP